MAKGVFTFRITAEGVDELRRKLEELGPAGQKAFDSLKAMSPQLASSFEAAGKSADQARAKIEQMPRGLGALSAGFEKAEGAVKSAGRTFNDATGAFQLLIPQAGAAGDAFSVMSRTIAGVSDVFGILASSLARNPFTAIVSAAAVAGTVFLTLRSNVLGVGDAMAQIKPQLEGLDGILKGLDAKLAEARGGVMGDVERKAADLLRMRRAAELELQRVQANGGAIDMSGAGSSFGVMPATAGETRQRVDALNREIGELDKRLREIEQRRQALRELEAEGADFTSDPTNARGRALAERTREEIRKREQAAEEARRKAEQAAEQARRETERDNERTRQDEQRALENYQRREQAVGKFIEKLEQEGRLAQQTNAEREVGLKIYEAQQRLVSELGVKMRDLTDAERERIANAVKTREAFEAQARAAEKLKQEMERAAARSTDRLVDFAGDALFDRLTGKSANFWETFKNWGLRAISQIAAEAVIRPIIAPIVSSVVSAAPGLFGVNAVNPATQSVAGGGGSLFSSPISSLFSTGGSLLSAGLGGGGGLLQTIGGAIGSALGFGGGSAALGAFSAGAFAASATATGAAAAATAGSSLAAGGVLGSAAGSVGAVSGGAAALSPLAATGIGALVAVPALLALGGLFGRKKSVGPFASYAASLGADGALDSRGGGEKNGGSMAQMRDATEAFASSIRQVATALGIFRMPGALNIGVGSNVARGTFFGTAGDESGAVYFGQDAGEAAAAYVRASLNRQLKDGAADFDATTSAARLFARTTGDPKTDLEFVAVYEGLDRTAAVASQVSRVLDELNANFDRYASTARRYGLEVDRVEKGRAEALENAVAQLMAPVTDRLSGIRGLVASLTVGPASPLSAQQQLDAARSQFSALETSARGGDEMAQRALGDAGRAYLDLARGFYATSDSYVGIYSDVVGRLGDIVRSVRDTDPTVRAIVESGERGTAAVTKALGTLVDEVKRLTDEVRRGNDIPMRVLA